MINKLNHSFLIINYDSILIVEIYNVLFQNKQQTLHELIKILFGSINPEQGWDGLTVV
jgi:peptide methionine sulfoxide reductase MsrA